MDIKSEMQKKNFKAKEKQNKRKGNEEILKSEKEGRNNQKKNPERISENKFEKTKQNDNNEGRRKHFVFFFPYQFDKTLPQPH